MPQAVMDDQQPERVELADQVGFPAARAFRIFPEIAGAADVGPDPGIAAAGAEGPPCKPRGDAFGHAKVFHRKSEEGMPEAGHAEPLDVGAHPRRVDLIQMGGEEQRPVDDLAESDAAGSVMVEEMDELVLGTEVRIGHRDGRSVQDAG